MKARLQIAITLLSALVLGPLVLACQATSTAHSWRFEERGGASALPEPLPGAPGRVLVISVAGLTPDLYTSPDSPMPVLSALARAGIATDRLVPVRPDTPFPTHATLVTGRRPAGHGIVADRLIGDRGVREVRFWHASRLTAPTLWERAQDAGLEVAALGWPTTVGADIALLVPDLGVTRENDNWLALQRQTATPRLYERLAQMVPPDARRPGSPWPDPVERDQLVEALACELVAEPNAPQLFLLRFAEPDEALRSQGPGGAELKASYAAVDARLGRLLGCLARAELLSSTAVVVVGDRSIRPVHTSIEPNALLVGAELISLGEDGTAIDSWLALARSNGGSAFVYADDEASAVEARRVLSEVAKGSRAFRVVPATELQAYDADPQAWFGLEAESGFVFGDGVLGPVIGAARERGGSGYLRPERRGDPGLVAWGQGLRSRLHVPEMRMEDVAPTVAVLLDLEFAPTDGRALIGLTDLGRKREPSR